MKKIILIVVLIATGLVQNSFAQDSTAQYLQKIITDYLNVKNALTKDNGDTARTAANSLSAEFKNVSVEMFPTEQKNIWLKYYEELTNVASNIGSTTDISEQREQFKDLSSNFYELLKEMKINSVDLFYQYCPMADAYWISEKSKISNPYMGKKMPTCGSTKE